MTASDTRDSELAPRGAALKARVLALPEDAPNMDIIADLAEWAADCYDYALDTIDRLTSTGEAVPSMYVPAYYLEAIKYRRVRAVTAASEPNEVCDTPLYTHASPREGHVEVPDGMVLVPREADGAMATAAYKDQPGAINWSATQAWRTMVRAALQSKKPE